MKPAWFLRSRNPRAKHWLSQSRIKTETGSISTWLYFSLKAKFNNNNNACVPQEVESREKCSAEFFMFFSQHRYRFTSGFCVYDTFLKTSVVWSLCFGTQ